MVNLRVSELPFLIEMDSFAFKASAILFNVETDGLARPLFQVVDTYQTKQTYHLRKGQ